MARSDAQNAPQNSLSEALVRYRLLRETRRGGMSQIWEAIDTQTGRRVAVKRLSAPTTVMPNERRAWLAQIERAAQEIARLQHPNIAAVYDVGQDNGQPFLVTDLLPGRTLRQRLREGPLPPSEAARVLRQAAAALDAAHAVGLAHGGLKPTSIRLLPSGAVKLTDFGIARPGDTARVLPEEKTANAAITETMIGSPSYLSPEQIGGGSLSPASDVWALGVILYEMLAGYPPFSGSHMEAVLQQITTGSLPPLPRMPPSIQTVLSRALAKDPAQRYGQAGELAAALQNALPTTRAVPLPSGLPRSWRTGRRAAFALAGVSLLAMLFLALHAYYAPIAHPPPVVPALPAEAVLPVPQSPPLPSPDESPFTPVPAPPVEMPVTEPPIPIKKHHDGKPKG